MFFPLHPGWLQDCSDALAALTDLIPQLSSASEGSRRSLLCHAQVCILKDEAELIRAPKKPVGRGYSNHLGETGSHKKDPQWRLYLGVAQGEEHPLATPTGFSCENTRMELPWCQERCHLPPAGTHPDWGARASPNPQPRLQVTGGCGFMAQLLTKQQMLESMHICIFTAGELDANQG